MYGDYMSYGYGYGYDWTYILVIIGALLSMAASTMVNTTYQRYARVASRTGLTGAQTAERILRMNGVTDVSVQHVKGTLTDHYDPARKVVNLSDSTYNSRSVAAIGVAAHECGHVMQHHEGYMPLSIRTALVPLANIGSNAGIWIVVAGLALGLSQTLTNLGIILFSCGVLFQIVTLPVEFNASHRALQMLVDYGILDQSENAQTRKVLRAAAMTYVAAAASSILTLVRLMYLSSRSRRRDDRY